MHQEQDPYGVNSNFILTFTPIVISLNQIVTFLNVGIQVRVAMLTGKSYFKRVYTWFDVCFYSLNTVAN